MKKVAKNSTPAIVAQNDVATIDATTPATPAIDETTPATPAFVRETRNGIREPNNKGLNRAVWNLADEIAKDATLTYKQIRERVFATGSQQGLNAGNMRTELSYWRRFNDIAK